MKKRIIGAVLILLTLLIAAGTIIAPRKGTITYKLEGTNYTFLTAKTPEEWEKGLMNVRGLENADGMIFIFPKKEIQNFWNKNTYVDLDVYWLDDDKVVGRSVLPSIEKGGEVTVTSPTEVNKVIELIR